jgi:hypothetical protein
MYKIPNLFFLLFFYSCNKNENKPDETPSYGFVQLNHDHHSMKSDESIVSPLLKTNSTHDKGIII